MRIESEIDIDMLKKTNALPSCGLQLGRVVYMQNVKLAKILT